MGAGGANFRKFYQLACAAHALQQEFDLRGMRMLCRKVNGLEYGSFIDQPVLTRWENVSRGHTTFLLKRRGFFKFCKAVCYLHNTTHSKNKIASDHMSLAKE